MMKRLAALSVCILLMMVATAGATVILPVNVTDGGIGLVATLDTTSVPGYDVVDLYVTSLPSGMTGLQIVQGEIDAVGGTFYVYNKAATNLAFQSDTTQLGLDAGLSPPYTAWDFSTANGAAVWSRDGGTTHNSASLMGGWHDNGVAGDAILAGTNLTKDDSGGTWVNGDGYARNFLAEFVVTTGTTQITCTASQTDPREVNGFNYLPLGQSLTTAFNVPIVVPEPSTIALLGCGLFGLLAYAWRKRK